MKKICMCLLLALINVDISMSSSGQEMDIETSINPEEFAKCTELNSLNIQSQLDVNEVPFGECSKLDKLALDLKYLTENDTTMADFCGCQDLP